MTKFRAGLLGLVSMILVAPQVVAAEAVEIPVIDMREATPEQAREKARQMSENGVAILYLSANDPPERSVQAVAGECAEGGFQVRALILAAPGADAEGMVLFGATGGPLGPTIPVSSNLKAATKAQVQSLKERLAHNPAGMSAIDPMDVVRCRYELQVGSRVRKEKVCTTPRQDAQNTEQNKSWTKRMQDRSANEPMATPGG
jgi:pyocin large subunit-like protein